VFALVINLPTEFNARHPDVLLMTINDRQDKTDLLRGLEL